MRSLRHRAVIEISSLCSLLLPICESLQVYFPQGTFPLVHNADERKLATIMGMFVLRPAYENWCVSMSDPEFVRSMYALTHWAYNFDGLDGGWLISSKNAVDSFRLALQYGTSDAVIVGTKSVSAEGCNHVVDTPDGPVSREGYAWLPYVVTEWPQLKQVDANLAQKIQEQRVLWQSLGYLSSRKYPAQILVTESGQAYDGCADFLQARIFSMIHPEGDAVEIYIITSATGAERIRSRASKFGLGDRIESMLIVLSPPSLPTSIDYKAIPELLYSRLGMKLVDHDGGQAVLRKFCQEGIISQFNLTLMRQQSLHAAIEQSTILDSEVSTNALQSFDKNTRMFFSENTSNAGAIPSEFKIMSLIEDEEQKLVVATFSAEDCSDF